MELTCHSKNKVLLNIGIQMGLIMKKAFNFLTEYSLLLIIGALIALVWANINYESYHHFVEYPIWDHGFLFCS